MRVLAIWLVVASAVLVFATMARAQGDLGPFEPRQLIRGVHLLSTPPDYLGPATGNVTIIEQEAGFVVVDSGLTRADGDRIVGFVRALGDQPVIALVITHWHNDHPQGASQILEAWPDIRIIATRATADGIAGPAQTQLGFEPSPEGEAEIRGELETGLTQIDERIADPETDGPTRMRYRRMAEDMRERIPDLAGTHLVPPNEILEEEILIDDPVRPIRVMFLGRANTAGDAVVWLPNQRLIVTGDIVVSPIPFGFFSFPEDWIATLGRIKALEFDLLVPGHGEPQTDSAYIDRLVATIADIRSQVGRLAGEGLTLEEVREQADFSEQTAIFGTSNRRRVLFDAYWLRPMVENAYKEATGVPIVQGEGETP